MDIKKPGYPRWGWRQLLLANLAIVAVHLATRLAANALALGENYVLPLFPPAGVALALATIGGARVLPGVVAGVALVNLPWYLSNTAHHRDQRGRRGAASLARIAPVPALAAAGHRFRPGRHRLPRAHAADLPDQRHHRRTGAARAGCGGRCRTGPQLAGLVGRRQFRRHRWRSRRAA